MAVVRRSGGQIAWDTFRNIGRYLPANALLVLNDTKVIPARLQLTKPTGGRVDVLCVARGKGIVSVLANKPLAEGMCLRLPGRRFFTVIRRTGKTWDLRPSFPLRQLDALLQSSGTTPLPPYIKNTPLTERQLRREYQSVWAEKRGSVAAPTASLHFTAGLLRKLQKQGITVVHVTLHVNLGTFAPVTDEHLRTGKLHTESYVISPSAARAITAARKVKRPIIAVGTTAARALESAADSRGVLQRLQGSTDLFIREGYRFRLVEGLITNFHVPKSSLLMLVAALIGRSRVLQVYQEAIHRGFRLFSFGDGMLILP